MKLRNPFRKKPVDPEVKAAYDKSFREAQLERAKKAGRTAGLKKPKSVFEKIGDFGEAITKDFSGGSGGFFGGDLFGESKPKRKRKSRKKRRKK